MRPASIFLIIQLSNSRPERTEDFKSQNRSIVSLCEKLYNREIAEKGQGKIQFGTQ